MFSLSASPDVSIAYSTSVYHLMFLFHVQPLAFMFKLPLKLQPLKNFKYKYLFGDKISKGDDVFGSHFIDHDDVFLFVHLLWKLTWNLTVSLWIEFWHKRIILH